MPLVSQTLRTAVKGLITEKQELVFPEDASVDELNCELLSDGRRRRRKAVALETNNVLSSFVIASNVIVHEETWFNVGGLSNLEYLVVQVEDTLRFYDKSVDPVSSSEKSFTVNLNSFGANNGVSIGANSFQASSLDGVLVVTHPGCNAFYITYDETADDITTVEIEHKVRDFEWQGDTTTYFTPKANPSVDRQYDTLNSGWHREPPIEPLTVYQSNTEDKYPELTVAYHVGVEDHFSESTLKFFNHYTFKTTAVNMTSLASNGHFILNFFSKDRESKVAGVGVAVESSRFRTVEAFAGRFWYGGLTSQNNSGRILFTKIIESENDYGLCYQVNDPTNPDFSDLLDTDGGTINIPEAYGINKLYSFGSNLLVFAENGVWIIKGVDGVFKATEYSVSKVSVNGLMNPNTFVDVDSTPFWWSKFGIHTVQKSEVSLEPLEVNLTEGSIQTFWNDIDIDKKLEVKSCYDPFNKIVYWMYPSNSESTQNKYNKFLLLDVTLQAFVPWEVEDQEAPTNYIVGMFFCSPLGSLTETDEVLSSGEEVVTGVESVVVSGSTSVSTRESVIKVIVRDGTTGKMTLGEFSSTGFLDWGDSDYSSYVELGYAFFDNLSIKKQPIYITTYFTITESGFEDNGDGSYDLLTPSACTLKTFWDFKDTASSSQNVYRLKKFPVVDSSDLGSFDYGSHILINKTRLKGRGRNMNLKFESQTGKDFVFLGYEMLGFMNEGI